MEKKEWLRIGLGTLHSPTISHQLRQSLQNQWLKSHLNNKTYFYTAVLIWHWSLTSQLQERKKERKKEKKCNDQCKHGRLLRAENWERKKKKWHFQGNYDVKNAVMCLTLALPSVNWETYHYQCKMYITLLNCAIEIWTSLVDTSVEYIRINWEYRAVWCFCCGFN